MTKKYINDKEILRLGEFNINLMNLNSILSRQDFYDFFISENYTPLIIIPTRVTPTSATCLDHIYVNLIKKFLPVFLKIILVTIMLLSAVYLIGQEG